MSDNIPKGFSKVQCISCNGWGGKFPSGGFAAGTSFCETCKNKGYTLRDDRIDSGLYNATLKLYIADNEESLKLKCKCNIDSAIPIEEIKRKSKDLYFDQWKQDKEYSKSVGSIFMKTAKITWTCCVCDHVETMSLPFSLRELFEGTYKLEEEDEQKS